MLIPFLFESCKKDPIEKAKYEFFKDLKGIWTLSDYTASGSGWGGGSTEMFSYDENSVFSNNWVTLTNIHTTYNYPNSITDTTVDTFEYIKHLDFDKYKKDILNYTESTIKSGTLTTNSNSVDWTDLTIDSLIIKIENNYCNLIIDGSSNLIITYDESYYHTSGGNDLHIKWIFRKE